MTMIRFYEKTDKYYEFSNFFASSFELDGKTWSTVEHYFQAQKFIYCPEYAKLIREADTPNKAFKLARQRKLGGYMSKWQVNKLTTPITINDAIDKFRDTAIIRADWEQVKETIMKLALFAKFTQNETLKQILLNTGTNTIIEASPRDSYWGEGRDGTGLNRLGFLLMEVRQELKQQSSS